MEGLIYAILWYNYIEDITGKKSGLAHLSRTGGCKGMFSILCMLVKPELHSATRELST